ncbi:MAG: isoleucine--tRNA ligase [Euryarchaeota archaeon]|nr:isoleucine--tRNA ligase [Euryarchaeota archaeon]
MWVVHPVDKRYNPKELEHRIMKFWEENKAYERTKEILRDKPVYFFVDGPPYTSGYIHPGTSWNKVLKDLKLRYLRMRGYNVFDKPGYDTHGLPIEVKVESTLGIKRKAEIYELGVDKFVEKCREFAKKHLEIMTEEFKRIGIWMDWNNPYITFTDDYIESEWWSFKQLWERGLIEKKEYTVTWCPRCETSLANAELEYKDKEDPSIYVKFPVKGKNNEFIVIWTTTPWTLPANLAVAVHPELEYARVKVRKDKSEEIWILAKELVEDVALRAGYEVVEILETFKGSDLEGLEYVHPLLEEVPYHKSGPKGAYRIILGEHVTAERTGCVHTAPGHGEEDFEVGQRYRLPAFCPVDERGVFTDAAGKYSGMLIWEANKHIIEDLKRKGLLLHEEKIVHSYAHCWRCKTPIIYRTTTQWFYRVTKIKDKLVEALMDTEWTPKWAKNPRMLNWLKGIRDWCISRQRFWGTPIPVWECPNGHTVVIGSKKELEQYAGELPQGFNLHKPWVDEVTFKCPICGEEMKRVPDVLDVWFDSAVCSWAEIGYPANNKEFFEKYWPCEWITEAHDQIRGWFYSQLAVSTGIFGKAPYKRVLMHGWALDEEGRPMSKSLGNFISPVEIAEKYGADSFRMYVLSSAAWEDKRFSIKAIQETQRKLSIIWSVYHFATLYMSLDKFDPDKVDPKTLPLRTEDKWILSRLDTLIEKVTESIEKDMFYIGANELLNFGIEDLSHWYIRLIRDRTWIEENTPDKLAAYWTLYTVLLTYSKLLAPFTPYLAEEIYQNLSGKMPSVAVEEWPKKLGYKDERLERAMEIIKEISEAVSALRQKAKIKLRWPLREMAIVVNKEIADLIKPLEEILKDIVNVKSIRYDLPEWGVPRKKLKPIMSAIGRTFRKDSKEVLKIIEEREDEIVSVLETKGSYETPCGPITRDHVEIIEELQEGVEKGEIREGEIYLLTRIDKELLREAYAREIVRRVQETRKRTGYDVSDYIILGLEGDPELMEAARAHSEYISNETRAQEIAFEALNDCDNVTEWTIDEKPLKVYVKRASK